MIKKMENGLSFSKMEINLGNLIISRILLIKTYCVIIGTSPDIRDLRVILW